VGCWQRETLLVRETCRIFECDRVDQPTVEFGAPKNSSGRQSICQQTTTVRRRKGRICEFHIVAVPYGQSSMFMLWASCEGDGSGRREFVEPSPISPSASTRRNLRRSEAYLSEAQRLSHTGSWACVPAIGKHTYGSEEAFRIYGFDPAGGPPRFEEFERRSIR